MSGLLLKDWFYVRKKGLIYIVCAVIACVCILHKDIMFSGVLFPCMFMLFLSANIMISEETDRWESFRGIFPWTAEQVIASKYTGLLAVNGLFYLLTAVCCGLSMYMHIGFDIQIYMLIMAITAFIIAISIAFMYIAYSKFGGAAGAAVIYMTVLFSIILSTGYLYKFADTLIYIGNGILISAVLFIMSVIIILISWKASVYLYKNRYYYADGRLINIKN